jgi:hypothetical protein
MVNIDQQNEELAALERINRAFERRFLLFRSAVAGGNVSPRRTHLDAAHASIYVVWAQR